MPYKSKAKQKAALQKHYLDNKQDYVKRANDRREGVKALLQEIKATKSCIECGESHPACLDFHHRDRSEKVITISKGVTSNRLTKQKLLDEITKCDVLCANCHRKHHYNENRALLFNLKGTSL